MKKLPCRDTLKARESQPTSPTAMSVPVPLPPAIKDDVNIFLVLISSKMPPEDKDAAVRTFLRILATFDQHSREGTLHHYTDPSP